MPISPSPRSTQAACLALILSLLAAGCSGTAEGEPAPAGSGIGGTIDQSQDDAPPTATATPGTGIVEGTVLNDNGAWIKGAHVAILGTRNGTNSDARGRFAFSSVEPGTYTLRVDAESYLSLEQPITVAAGKRTLVNATLASPDVGGAGFREHFHDLWGQQTRITIFDGDVRMDSSAASGGRTTASLCTSTTGGVNPSHCRRATIPLPDGAIVNPGTRALVTTAEWPQPAAPEVRVSLRYAPPSVTAVKFLPLVHGQGVELPIDYSMNDHGHQTYSLWTLEIYVETFVANQNVASNDYNRRFIDPVHVKLEILKGEVPPEPAHPRHWASGDTVTLLDEETKTQTLLPIPITRDPRVRSCASITYCYTLPPNVLVPPGTTRLDVTFTWTSGQPSAEGVLLPAKTLIFRTAAINPRDATMDDLRKDAPTGGAGTHTLTWSLPVAPAETDAFYQKSSLWLFYIIDEGTENEDTFIESCPAGCGGWTYTLTVVAANDDWTPDLAPPPEPA